MDRFAPRPAEPVVAGLLEPAEPDAEPAVQPTAGPTNEPTAGPAVKPADGLADRLAAVILSGGRGRRLGELNKANLVVGETTLIDRAVHASAGAGQIVVVGPAVPIAVAGGPSIRFVEESPPFGGPAAGLLAGRDAVGSAADWLLVLAVDMAGVHAATVRRLIQALAPGLDGAFLHDADGRRQLAGVVRAVRLDAVRPPPDQVAGLSVRRLLDPLRIAAVPAHGTEGIDLDTWADLDRHQSVGPADPPGPVTPTVRQSRGTEHPGDRG
ncbi:MAG: NTP transferase domain-containing protein [Nocardioides sp.]